MLSDTQNTEFSMVNRKGFTYKANCAILGLQEVLIQIGISYFLFRKKV